MSILSENVTEDLVPHLQVMLDVFVLADEAGLLEPSCRTDPPPDRCKWCEAAEAVQLAIMADA